jgi:hypothetical protein
MDHTLLSKQLRRFLPAYATIRNWIHGLWTARFKEVPLISDLELAEETKSLAFDYTYKIGMGSCLCLCFNNLSFQ